MRVGGRKKFNPSTLISDQDRISPYKLSTQYQSHKW